MYSYEDRKKAVDLYIKYDLCYSETARVLGYPDRKTLKQWYKEYEESGNLHEQFVKHPQYTVEQMQAAVDYYFEHGRSITRTLRAMGYPSKGTFLKWVDELAPGKRKARIKRSGVVLCSQEQKKEAVIELCTRGGSAANVADKLGVSRVSLYNWKIQLLGEDPTKMTNNPNSLEPQSDIETLTSKLELLNKQIYRQQMELDILNKAAEIIKKDQGINPRKLTNKEKTHLIDALRTKYSLNGLLLTLEMSKSSYFYQKSAQ